MQSTNPVLSRRDAFSRNGYATFRTEPPASAGGITYRHPDREAPPQQAPAGRPMSLDDVISKTALLLGVAVLTGALAWAADLGWGVAIVAMLVGFGLAMVNSFKRVPSPPLIIAYAAVEGVFLGVISNVLEARYPGVVVQAVAGTAIVFGVMLALYRSGKIRVTPRFTKVLIAAALAYFVLMLGNLVLHLFDSGFNAWGGAMGLLTAGIGVVLASLFLTLDFDMIEGGVRAGAPEVESWRAAFGLTVTLVWLYFELLRLISILRGE